MSKSSCLKWTHLRSGIDYRVALLFTRYITAKVTIPESLKLIGQINEKTKQSRTDVGAIIRENLVSIFNKMKLPL